MPVTPRRSTRQTAIFTPLSAVKAGPARYEWTSAAHPDGARTSYTSFARTRGAGRKADEARFSIGDGVSVALEGGAEGIGMLVGLWEEPVSEDEREPDDDELDEHDEADEPTRRMARVHWFFRRSDLPSVMRNLTLEDVSRPRPWPGRAVGGWKPSDDRG
jgi:origin recognition complex subunit 1